MENIKEFLSSIGFGKNETEIYSVLVEMGTSSVLEISKKTKIHRSNIYDALRKLVQEGLVFEVNDATKKFSARPPQSLINYLKQKEADLKMIVENYEKRKLSKPKENQVQITKGIFAAREALFSLLETNEEILVWGIPSEAPEKLGPLLQEFHKERVEKGIFMKHIYNSDSEKRAKLTKKLKLTENRVLPSKYDAVVSTNISGDKTVLFLWEDEVTVIEIKDQFMAEAYKKYFEILWSKAKVIE